MSKRVADYCKYLSPTSIGLFMRDPQEFYLKYIDKELGKRLLTPFVQTIPMAIGATFDAIIKGYLIGLKTGVDDTQGIYQGQVDSKNRTDSIYSAGMSVFKDYQSLGGIRELLTEIKWNDPVIQATTLLESDFIGTINGVPCLGKPDLWNKEWIIDWKVKGKGSPVKGYSRQVWKGKVSSHPDTVLIVNPMNNDYFIQGNQSLSLEKIEESWALQMGIYILLSGNLSTVYGIEQLIIGEPDSKNQLRLVSYRGVLPEGFLLGLKDKVKSIWEYTFDDDAIKGLERLVEEVVGKKENWLKSVMIRDLGGDWWR